MVDSVLDRFAQVSLHSSFLTSSQQEMDRLVSGFAAEAANPLTLAAMVAGGSAFRLGRIGGFGLSSAVLGGAESAVASFGSRAFAVGLGFAAETLAFEGTQRALRVGLNGEDASLLRWDGVRGFRNGWLNAALSLGPLKAAGHFAQGQNVILQHLISDSAMVFSHQAAGALHLAEAPSTGLAEQFLSAEATQLQMAAGMGLLHGAFPQWAAVERGLDLEARAREVGPRQGNSPSVFSDPFAWQAAGVAASESVFDGLRPGMRSSSPENIAEISSQPSFMIALREPGSAPSPRTGSEGRVRLVEDQETELPSQNIVIVGAGPAGALTASRLLTRHPETTSAEQSLQVYLIGSQEPALGLPYAPLPGIPEGLARFLRVNVRAKALSALPEDPQHFFRWAHDHDPEGVPDENAFAARVDYGRYLSGILNVSEANALPGRSLRRIRARATGLAIDGPTHWVRLSNGEELRADQIVYAPGNFGSRDVPLPEGDPAILENQRLYTRNPLLQGLSNVVNLGREDPVLVVGSGLTGQDLSLLLALSGFKVQAVSRNGHWPVPHALYRPFEGAKHFRELFSGRDLDGLREVFQEQVALAQAAGSDARAVLDGFRPGNLSNDLWRTLSDADQDRFPWREWDLLRHRIPTPSHQRLRELSGQGKIRIDAATVVSMREEAGGIQVVLQKPNGERETRRFGHVFNSIGPNGNYEELRESDPFIDSAMRLGMMVPNDLRMGLKAAPNGALVDREGRPSSVAFTLGPPLKGNRGRGDEGVSGFEVTAMPEVAPAALRLADDILERARGRRSERPLPAAVDSLGVDVRPYARSFTVSDMNEVDFASLPPLVRTLAPVVAQLFEGQSPEAALRTLQGLSFHRRDVRNLALFGQSPYTRNILLEVNHAKTGEQIQVVMFGWGGRALGNQKSPIHDHFEGVEVVFEGDMQQTVYQRNAAGGLKEVERRLLEPGETASVGDVIHRIANVGEGNGITLVVYRKPTAQSAIHTFPEP
ncbi:MAG: FAD/NAD(P)-binding protein [bacterium]